MKPSIPRDDNEQQSHKPAGYRTWTEEKNNITLDFITE